MSMEKNVAFSGEVMLAGWNESHSGGAKVTFWLSSSDDLEAFRHMTVKKGGTAGQRLMAVFVELGDDEQPVTVAHSRQAAMMCKNGDFQRFAKLRGYTANEEGAAEMIRSYCSIASRAELDTSDEFMARFTQLQKAYRTWLLEQCREEA